MLQNFRQINWITPSQMVQRTFVCRSDTYSRSNWINCNAFYEWPKCWSGMLPVPTMGSHRNIWYLLNANNDKRLFLIVPNELNKLTSLKCLHFVVGYFLLLLFVWLFVCVFVRSFCGGADWKTIDLGIVVLWQLCFVGGPKKIMLLLFVFCWLVNKKN